MNIDEALMRLKWSIAFFLTLFLLACGEDDEAVKEPVSPAEFLILNDVNHKPNVSLYDYNSKALTESFYTSKSQYNDHVAAAAKKDNHLLIVTGTERKLIKININTGKEERVADSWIDFPPIVEFHGNNIIVCELRSLDPMRPLVTKIYSGDLILLDSITEENVAYLSDVAISDNELFYLVRENAGSTLKARDLTTKQMRTLAEFDQPCSDLLWVGNNKLLVVTSDEYRIIDTRGISAPVVGSADITNATFDPETNTLYFLDPAAQPSPVPYYLSKLDLSTGEKTMLANGEHVVPPLLYDAKTKLIVSGGIKVFSEEGDLLHTAIVSQTTNHIFKR
jgi:hypothetical protein